MLLIGFAGIVIYLIHNPMEFGRESSEEYINQTIGDMKKNMIEKMPINYPQDDSLEEFRKVCVRTHNVYRDLHNVPHLEPNTKLHDYAQAWAQILATLDVLDPPHRVEVGEQWWDEGENIYVEGSNEPNFILDGETPVKAWYSEIKYYDFDREGQTTDNTTGHFTQVIWKSSAEVGCGRAYNKKRDYAYVVANYMPAGNFKGQYMENVFPVVVSKNE